MRNLANFALFQLAWFAVVSTAAEGRMWIGPAVVAVTLAVHFRWVARPGERADEAIYVIAVGLAGLAADTGLGLLGATAYPTSAEAWPWVAVPPWIVSLWVLFATLPRHSMAWLHGRPLLGAAFGALGGPLSYLAGTRFGAVAVGDSSLLTWGALALEYAVAMPLLLAFAERRSGPDAT